MPFTSFAEPNPAAKVPGGRTQNVWFARSPERSVMFFAGLWTRWRGVKRVRDGERDYELFGFLTCEPNAVVAPIHKKAMPVILTEPDEIDLWLSAPWNDAKRLQRPLPNDMLTVVDPPAVNCVSFVS